MFRNYNSLGELRRLVASETNIDVLDVMLVFENRYADELVENTASACSILHTLPTNPVFLHSDNRLNIARNINIILRKSCIFSRNVM